MAEAWRPAGYGAAVLTLDTDTDQGAVDACKAQWPEHDNVYLADSHPAAIELKNGLRAGGRLPGPAG